MDGLQFELEHNSPRLLRLNRFSQWGNYYAILLKTGGAVTAETFQGLWYSAFQQARKCAIGVADF
ncbi:hypothetical protein [Pantoea conspicua]|uniref:hypothetical protein n=1 Tax=Pantoea conspicua TaxID=472705 RepID=UPI00117EE90D|nr:hypothetical protein [Pantoea conspicua]